MKSVDSDFLFSNLFILLVQYTDNYFHPRAKNRIFDLYYCKKPFFATSHHQSSIQCGSTGRKNLPNPLSLDYFLASTVKSVYSSTKQTNSASYHVSFNFSSAAHTAVAFRDVFYIELMS